ncbi:MAG: hypothetical protein R2864_12700 [Syntrophotaleaceae bacterium]
MPIKKDELHLRILFAIKKRRHILLGFLLAVVVLGAWQHLYDTSFMRG